MRDEAVQDTRLHAIFSNLHSSLDPSLSYVSYKNRKAVAADLRLIYTSSTEAEAEQQLVAFAEKWDKQYPTIKRSWMNHWTRVTPFFGFPPEIRRAIYTTNAIESINMTLRKVREIFDERSSRNSMSDFDADSSHLFNFEI